MSREFDDASSEYLQVAISQSEAFTLACWTWLDDESNHSLLSFGQSAGTYYHALMFYSHALQAYSLGSSSDGASASSAPGVSEWFHGCGVWAAADDRRCYLNGGNKGTNATTVTVASPNQFRVGVTGDSTPYGYHDGKIAEVGLWNVALTDAEVAILGAGYSPLFVKPENLIAYWPLIRDEDQDRVGGYDFTAYNTPTVAAHPPIIHPAQVYQSFAAAAAPPAGISIPVAMRYYRNMRI
jgi:hypothetical protein